MWEFYGILCFLDHGWYVLGMRDEWPFTRVFGSLSYPPFHHWWYFLYCTNMGWSSLIPLSHCFLLYPITSFQIFVPLFIHSLLIDTHYWFDTFFTSFTYFIDGLTTHLSLISPSTFPLVTFRSMAHEIYLCITSYTRGYGFDHWVFEPSFPSFLSPYHPGLRYVPCLKTTLRPRDQTLSLTIWFVPSWVF